MADLQEVDDFLAHHGVKGMKWGVRRDPRTGIRPIAQTLNDSAFGQNSIKRANAYGAKQDAKIAKKKAKQVAKADQQWNNSLVGVHGFVKVNNAIADRINPRLDKLNAKPKYQGDLTKNEALHKEYINEYRSLLQTSLNEVSSSIGTNASGTQRLGLTLEGTGMETSWRADFVDVKHAVSDTAFRIVPQFNTTGHITGFELEPMGDALSHGEDLVDFLMFSDEDDEFLEHFGVKGMKWGVRRENRVQRLERIASGTASKGERARYALTEATSQGVRRHGGLAGAAGNKAANIRAVDARIKSGQATVRDILRAHGGDRIFDTGGIDRDRTVPRAPAAPKGNSRRENRAERLERIASGTATRGENLRYATTEATSLGVRRNGGVAGAAGNKAANIRAVDARIARGEATVRDLIRAHGGDRLFDTGGLDKDRR